MSNEKFFDGWKAVMGRAPPEPSPEGPVEVEVPPGATLKRGDRTEPIIKILRYPDGMLELHTPTLRFQGVYPISESYGEKEEIQEGKDFPEGAENIKLEKDI